MMNDNFRSSRKAAQLAHLDATIGPTILLDVERRAQSVSLAQTLSLVKLSPGICFSLPVQADAAERFLWVKILCLARDPRVPELRAAVRQSCPAMDVRRFRSRYNPIETTEPTNE